ncbi:hypothetical protein L9F63_019401 [Diploptera punctata]|uniref:Ion transport peptide n=1 Tax=Diploptera punctata TaxID=6984 RepID=A0AAD7ZUC0_DIPPU|nr:hypothetical protein L9F63_019401 [Diploptera punctata]
MEQQLTRVLSCCILISIMITSLVAVPASGRVLGHSVSKRSFFELQCKGVFDKTIFARLDRVCEDCYNLFREPHLHTLCRQDCFTTDYFKGCMDVLLEDDIEKYQSWIKQLHGADPGLPMSNCFNTPYFNGCLEALLLDKEKENFSQMVEFLGKK